MVCKRWTNTILITFWIYVCLSHNQYPAFPKNHRNNWREKRKNKMMFLNSFNSLILNFNLTWVYQSDLIYPKGQSWSILWLSISEHQLLICSGCGTTPRAWGVNTKRDPCQFWKSTLKRKLHKALPLFVMSPLPIFHHSCGDKWRCWIWSLWMNSCAVDLLVVPFFQKCVNSTSCWPLTKFLFVLRLISSN